MLKVLKRLQFDEQRNTFRDYAIYVHVGIDHTNKGVEWGERGIELIILIALHQKFKLTE